MEEFNGMRINQYSIEELIEYLNKGYTPEDFNRCGLHYLKREQLEDYIWDKLCQNPAPRAEDYQAYINYYPHGKYVDKARQKIKEIGQDAARDKADWDQCVREDTLDAYKSYLKNHPQGAHAQEAQVRIDKIIDDFKRKKEELLEDMKAEPWKYTHENMCWLLDGADEGTIQALKDGHSPGLELATDFILNRLKITINDLYDYGVVPREVTKLDVTTEDFKMPAKTVKEIGSFPVNRTDVYFMGVPRSGKSSVLSGIIYRLWKTGCAGYEPHIVNGIDPCGGYYTGLIEALGNKKPPTATPDDTVSFMKLNIQNTPKRINDVTIVELAGEAFQKIADGMSSESLKAVWESLGATKCLQSSNRKCLFFVLDYSIISGRGGDARYNPQRQSMVLESALRVLSHDGPNPNNSTRNCTMSKVDSVAVIMTKSDLMGNATSRAQRTKIAEEYIYNNFSNFMNELFKTCKKYGANRNNHYRPYILTFSLGNFYVGNTVVFDPKDTDHIIQFIKEVTRTKKISSFNNPFD